jgi:hypothetical protein
MTTASLRVPREKEQTMSFRANALAERLERGVFEMSKLATSLTNAEWVRQMSSTDRRSIGTIVHHIGNMLPLEVQLAQMIASGKAIEGVTYDEVDKTNATHAKDFPAPSKEDAIDFLCNNSMDAAAAIRAMSDEELDRATPNSLYGDAVLTCQFMLEDHAVRHVWHHLAKIRAAVTPAR